MTNQTHTAQTLELAKSLERYAPAIVSTDWRDSQLDLVTVDALRIDSRHLPLLAQICLAGNVTLAIINHH